MRCAARDGPKNRSATVAVLAATTCGYYLSERRPLAAFAIVLVIAGIAGGLMMLRSPAEERVNRLDRRRVEDLQQIERAVNLHWTRQGRLPATLDELSADAGIRISANDPVTGEPYGYRPLDDAKFEVCAVFETAEPRELQISSFWTYGAGRQCFQPTAREIRPS